MTEPTEQDHDEVGEDWSRDEWWRRFEMYEDGFS